MRKNSTGKGKIVVNENILISVVMSVFNAQSYIQEAIESILTQTYENFELIIINDGSTDKSLELIESYKKNDNRIIIVSRENEGLIASLNLGCKLAQGKYIARMDADDVSSPDRFEQQVRFLEMNSEIGVCGSWCEVFGNHSLSHRWKMPQCDEELRVRLLFSVPFAHPSIMMRKELLEQYGLFYKSKYKNAEDYKFWLDLSQYTKFANIPKVLLRYRYLESSVSRQADLEQDDRFKTISSIFCKVLINLGIENTEKENRLHFTIGLNKRIEKEDIDLSFLDSYLTKIINANKTASYFDERYLLKFLSRKFLIVVYYLFKRRKYQVVNTLRSKYLYIGILSILSSVWQ